MLLLSDVATPTNTFTALQGTAGSVTGALPGASVSAGNVSVAINQTSVIDGPVLDFDYAPFAIQSAPGREIELTMNGDDGELLSARADLTIDIAGFFNVSGTFGIERKSIGDVDLFVRDFQDSIETVVAGG